MLTFSKPVLYKARVVEKTQLAPTVYIAHYELVTPTTLTFYAGQTIMIKVQPGANRAMSIASPPQETNVITSVQDVSPGGPASHWMSALKVGDTLEFMAPLGRFVLDHASPRKRILVATGTGIAPFRSMMLDSSYDLIGQREVSFYWGLRFKDDIYLQDELHTYVSQHPNLKYYLVLSKPPNGWNGLSGHTTEHVLAIEKDLVNTDYYLCGNKNMIRELTEKLEAMGVAKTQIKFDPYY